MNIEAYNLDSLRKLIRTLQVENKELRELLEKAKIPYSSSTVFVETPTEKQEFDLDQGGRISQQYIDKKLAIRFFSMFWGREDVFAKRAKNGNYYGYVKIPRGLLEEVVGKCKNAGIEYEIED